MLNSRDDKGKAEQVRNNEHDEEFSIIIWMNRTSSMKDLDQIRMYRNFFVSLKKHSV
jgi:hypothetical protein